MPRDGAILLTDLQAPFLRVVCEPCGRRGSYGVARLMAKHAMQSSPTYFLFLPIVRGRRIPPGAYMIVARPGSRRLFLATVPFFRQTNDDVAVTLTRSAERPERVDQIMIEPDPHLSVRADGPGRAIRQSRSYGLKRGRGNRDRDHRYKRANGRAVPYSTVKA
jgi:hypothetical protein